MSQIHPTAIVDKKAILAEGVKIGPYCQVGPHVSLEQDVELVSHVVLGAKTHIGAQSLIYPFASIGSPPQFIKGALSSKAEVVIGKNVVVREHVTINPGTPDGGLKTTIGDNSYLMISSHVGHDCHLGHHVVLTNNASLGGHCLIGDWAIIGGLTGLHQFVRVGQHAIIGGVSGVESDVIPYGSAFGNRATLHGLNIVGLKRRGFSRDIIHDLRSAYRLLFADEGTLAERIEDVAQTYHENKPVMEIIHFMRAKAPRSLCLP